ncbi:glycosyl transferase family 90-domain-containing protein [Mycena belliarum]|uniref:Glycosyl transferase family 90-domain-containing protein n=1 Tax=Mycena belliarum TaxID=1033014 RepID=A0AAD6UJK4_9AGAR|nr:glycosyl transferase family 90-domain-containing protein [Mycena belliae]
MAYDPASTVARPLLALAASPSAHRRPLFRRPRALLLFVGGALTLIALTLFLGPSVGLPIPVPERLAEYYPPPWKGQGNAPPPAAGSAKQPYRPGGAGGKDAELSHAPLDTPDAHLAASAAVDLALAAQPATLAAARARYTLKAGRPPPRGFDAFFAFAQERGCLVDAYAGVRADFAVFWRVERASEALGGKRGRGWFRERVRVVEEMLTHDSHGLTALRLRKGAVVRPGYQGSYFDGGWADVFERFAKHLPDMTVLLNGRDEPRVVFDARALFEADAAQIVNLTRMRDRTPFALAPADAGAFFAARPGCAGVREGGKGRGLVGSVPFLLSPSSAEFTTDLVPVLSMTKLADGSGVDGVRLGGGSAAWGTGGEAGEGEEGAPRGETCFADVVVPGEFYYRNSWWAGKFERPNDVPWASKRDVLYWRGKSNGGHIRGTNYRAFPRFRLLDLAALPENRAKGLFDVRITAWHEGHCTDNCDADAIRKAYNITSEVEPREDAYKFKYLLDVDGNTFSGRYLGLLRSGGLVFKSTAFAEFFTPWLVPYEHFIPVRPDLADLPAKIEWARANDAEAHRIQEAGRIFAERVLTDAQNDCYWFAVLLEWGALWGDQP